MAVFWEHLGITHPHCLPSAWQKLCLSSNFHVLKYKWICNKGILNQNNLQFNPNLHWTVCLLHVTFLPLLGPWRTCISSRTPLDYVQNIDILLEWSKRCYSLFINCKSTILMDLFVNPPSLSMRVLLHVENSSTWDVLTDVHVHVCTCTNLFWLFKLQATSHSQQGLASKLVAGPQHVPWDFEEDAIVASTCTHLFLRK